MEAPWKSPGTGPVTMETFPTVTDEFVTPVVDAFWAAVAGAVTGQVVAPWAAAPGAVATRAAPPATARLPANTAPPTTRRASPAPRRAPRRVQTCGCLFPTATPSGFFPHPLLTGLAGGERSQFGS